MENIKEKITSSIKRARELGITLVSGDWGSSRTKCACPLGCLIMANNENLLNSDPEDNADIAAEILGVTDSWINNFIRGFDGELSSDDINYDDAWKLGFDMRIETIPMPHSAYEDYLNDRAAYFLTS